LITNFDQAYTFERCPKSDKNEVKDTTQRNIEVFTADQNIPIILILIGHPNMHISFVDAE
jgi:bacterioferritin (cytochrome b1)